MNLFTELKRRNVFRVGLAYLVGAWLVAQVVELAADSFAAPGWIMKMLIVLLVIGFPAVVFFAWAYEITPEGLKRESEVKRAESITHETARRLDYVTIVLVLAAVAITLADRHWFAQPVMPETNRSTPTAAQTEVEAPGDRRDAATDRSIAVLPFVNMSDDAENEYFADGLAEEILNRLAQLPELRVAGRTSSFQYKGRNKDLRDIAKDLNVAHILEGSVRRSGGEVRVTAQLVRATDGTHLWSQTYDRTLKDVFRIQDEIAENVAANLDVVMNDQRREMMRRVGVRSVDAFVAYQKGWQMLVEAHDREDVVDGLRQANEHLARATELYPAFGDAWYWQADLHQHILLEDDSSFQALERAHAEAQRLLSAATEHARSPQQSAFSNFTRAVFSDDWSNIRTLLERAWAAQTCVGPNWSELVAQFGMQEKILQEARLYGECQGGFHSAVAYQRLLEGLLMTGRLEEALAVADRAISQLGQSGSTSALRVEALLALGRPEEAAREAELIELEPRYGHLVALSLAAAGHAEEAKGAAEAWLALPDTQAYSRLALFAALGRPGQSRTLAASIDARPAGHLLLASAALECLCGAPFDIEVTPNFRTRLEEGNLEWPPAMTIRYPDNPFSRDPSERTD